jgi:hypothetical protein
MKEDLNLKIEIQLARTSKRRPKCCYPHTLTKPILLEPLKLVFRCTKEIEITLFSLGLLAL